LFWAMTCFKHYQLVLQGLPVSFETVQ